MNGQKAHEKMFNIMVIRQTQVKARVTCHSLPTRVTKTRKGVMPSVGEGAEQAGARTPLVGLDSGTALGRTFGSFL